MIFVNVVGDDKGLLQTMKKQNLLPERDCIRVIIRVDYPHALCSTFPPEFGSLGGWLRAYGVANRELSADVCLIENF